MKACGSWWKSVCTAIVENTAAAYGAKAKLTYRRNYPVLVNHDKETAFAASVASQIVGGERGQHAICRR